MKRLGVAAVLALVGWAVFFGSGGSDGGEVTVIENQARMIAAIDDMQLPQPQKRRLIAQAEREQLELWNFTVFSSKGAANEVYTVSTDRGAHSYTVSTARQSFILPVTRGQTQFSFTADSDNDVVGMRPKWHTPSGTFRYDVHPGQASTVQVR